MNLRGKMIKSDGILKQDQLPTDRQLDANHKRAERDLHLVFMSFFVYMIICGTISENIEGTKLVFIFGFIVFFAATIIFAVRHKSAFIAMRRAKGVALEAARREYTENYQG
jgi:positive regulator of sigma E activity